MSDFRPADQVSIEGAHVPFISKLDPANRWVLLRGLIPWMSLERHYPLQSSASNGAPVKSFQMALAAVYIQQRLGVTDQETVELITESPYLQYFIGLSGYQATSPFDSSMMEQFRTCLGPDLVKICKEMTKPSGIACMTKMLTSLEEAIGEGKGGQQLAAGTEASGLGAERLEELGSTLTLDATGPSDDIPYPVDLRLLNEARAVTELIIDELFKQLKGKVGRKPLCRRDMAHNHFLACIKKKRLKWPEIREAKCFQLNEIGRNLGAIDRLIYSGAVLSQLENQLYRKLLITSEVYRQQRQMLDADRPHIDDRIVKLSEPHVRLPAREKMVAD